MGFSFDGARVTEVLRLHGLADTGAPGDDASFCLQSLTEHAYVRLAPHAEIYPASMMKVPVAVALCDRLAHSNFEHELLEVAPEHITTNDAPSPLRLGYRATPRELLHLMIAFSDNIATNMLIDALGRETMTDVLRTYGCLATRITRYVSGGDPRLSDPLADGENAHPAIDSAHLFAKIARDEIPLAADLRAALRAQYWNAKLSAGLGEHDRFAHKTGDTSSVSHDGGILHLADGRSFVLVVYTKQPSSDETDRKFAAFMSELRPLL